MDAIEDRKEEQRQTQLSRLTGVGRIASPPPPQPRSSSIKIGDERAVYGPESDHSYLRDRYLAHAFRSGVVPNRRIGDTPGTVSRRLAQHAQQMQRLARSDEAGRAMVLGYFTERNRPFHGTVSDHSRDNFRDLVFGEFRADSTAATSLGALTPPVYLLEEWNKWRTAASPRRHPGRNRPCRQPA